MIVQIVMVKLLKRKVVEVRFFMDVIIIQNVKLHIGINQLESCAQNVIVC